MHRRSCKGRRHIRVDATVSYKDDNHEIGYYAHDDEIQKDDKYFKVYTPQENDDKMICNDEDECLLTDCPADTSTKCWWRLSNGRVLGMANGMLLEYDRSTLAPLGLVVSADELVGKQIAVVDSGIEECEINFEDDGMEGADCADFDEEDAKEQAVIMYDDKGTVTVIQPNEDGSYWRKVSNSSHLSRGKINQTVDSLSIPVLTLVLSRLSLLIYLYFSTFF